MNLRFIIGAIVIPIMSALFIAGGMAAMAFDTGGCGTGVTVPAGPINVAFCILDKVSLDLLAGMSLQAAFVDAATRCLGSPSAENVAEVSKMWDAHIAATERLRADGGK